MGNGTWIPLRPKATAGQVAQDEKDGKSRWGAPIRNWGEGRGIGERDQDYGDVMDSRILRFLCRLWLFFLFPVAECIKRSVVQFKIRGHP